MKLNLLLFILSTLITLSYTTTSPLVLSEIQNLRYGCYAPEPPQKYYYPKEETPQSNENQISQKEEGDYEWDELDKQNYKKWQERMENVKEWEKDFVHFGYECDESRCLTFILELEEKLASATNKIESCQQWENYIASDPGENEINVELVLVYIDCLEQKGHISSNFPANQVFYCEAKSLHDYIVEKGYVQEHSQFGINYCYQECEQNLTCEETECSDFIKSKWDFELEICTEVEAQKTQDFNNGLTTSADNFTPYTASYYQYCIQSQLEDNSNFKDVEIDYEDLEETYNKENDSYDYSILKTNQKSVLALKCYSKCYDEQNQYSNNDDLLVELYGEDYHELFENFDDDDDDNNIENTEGESSNPCDDKYCYAEFWECNKECQKEHCPSENCYFGDNSLEIQIEQKCLKFNEEYIENNQQDTLDIVNSEFSESYSECIQKLKDLIPENVDADLADKVEKQKSLYSCLINCTEDVEKQQKENNDLFTSQLVFTMGSLTLITLLI